MLQRPQRLPAYPRSTFAWQYASAACGRRRFYSASHDKTTTAAMERALAQAWMLVYRGSPRVDEALDLLRENSYEALQRRRSKFIGGKLTWASVCGVAVGAIAKGLLGDLDKALDAGEDAHTLAERLAERDRQSHARVTAEQRRRIRQLDAGICRWNFFLPPTNLKLTCENRKSACEHPKLMCIVEL